MRQHNFSAADGVFPPSFSYSGLSILLERTVDTLQADRCRKPESLPPACVIPGTRNPIWLLDDVLTWLASHREAPAVVTADQSRAPARSVPANSFRRRPTKVEQAEAAAVGLTVREFRARAVEGAK